MSLEFFDKSFEARPWCYDQFSTLTKLQQFRAFLSTPLEILSDNYEGLRFLSSRGLILVRRPWGIFSSFIREREKFLSQLCNLLSLVTGVCIICDLASGSLWGFKTFRVYILLITKASCYSVSFVLLKSGINCIPNTHSICSSPHHKHTLSL